MKLYLHIGTEKTGTTSIQSFLTENEDKLKSLGYGIIKTLGYGNNRELSVYAMDPKTDDDYTKSKNLNSIEVRKRFNKELEKKINSEIQSLSSNCHSVIITSEHFHSRLTKASELQKLKKLLDNFFESTTILGYFRPQVDLATSLYSTALRVGFKETAKTFIFNELRELKHYYDYNKLYEMWTSAFYDSAFIARPYDQSYFKNNDLIEDFCSLVGISELDSSFKRIFSTNRSISAIGQDVLRAVNEKSMYSGQEREQFIAWLEQNLSGKAHHLDPLDVEFLQKKYDLTNKIFVKRAFNFEYTFTPKFLEVEDKDVQVNILVELFLSQYNSRAMLTSDEINMLRDSAIFLEDKNMNLSLSLMKLALRNRPHGKFIQDKIEKLLESFN